MEGCGQCSKRESREEGQGLRGVRRKEAANAAGRRSGGAADRSSGIHDFGEVAEQLVLESLRIEASAPDGARRRDRIRGHGPRTARWCSPGSRPSVPRTTGRSARCRPPGGTTVSVAPPRPKAITGAAAGLRLHGHDAEILLAGEQQRPAAAQVVADHLVRLPAEERARSARPARAGGARPARADDDQLPAAAGCRPRCARSSRLYGAKADTTR